MERQEYLRQWRERNKEKIRIYNHEYNIKHNAKILERKKIWYKNQKKMKGENENNESSR